MRPRNTYVRARIDTETKQQAIEALEAMGLSVSDVIRLLLFRIAEEHRLPFEVKVPNKHTRQAMTELDTGKGKPIKDINTLMDDLNDEND